MAKETKRLIPGFTGYGSSAPKKPAAKKVSSVKKAATAKKVAPAKKKATPTKKKAAPKKKVTAKKADPKEVQSGRYKGVSFAKMGESDADGNLWRATFTTKKGKSLKLVARTDRGIKTEITKAIKKHGEPK